jgi:HEAT repeat protein
MPDQAPDNIRKEISRILSDLIKTIKVVSVYPENNPLPAKMKESFSERFIALIKDLGGLLFTIGQGEIRYQNEVVYRDGAPEESLAGIFHSSGITEISFSPKFGFDEANQFFKIMKAFVNRESGASDLVTLFWQANIAGFDYCTVEDVILREYDGGLMIQESMEGDDSFVRGTSDSSSDSQKVIYSSIFLDDTGGVGTKPSAGPAAAGSGGSLLKGAFFQEEKNLELQMGFSAVPEKKQTSQVDTILILNEAFALEDSERGHIEEILRQDAAFNSHDATIRLTMEMFSQEEDYSDFNETVTIVEKMQSEFLRAGKLNYAGEMLSALKEIDHRLGEARPQWHESIANALTLAGSKEKLDYLASALNGNPDISNEEVGDYLGHFGWEALSAVTGLLGELEHRHHRDAICEHLARTGREHIDIISRGIFDRRWFVVRNSVTILASIGSDKAYAYLEKAVGHEDPRVRQQVIKGLAGTVNDRGVDLIVKLVWDKAETVSQSALEALLNLEDEKALKAITALINDDRFTGLSFGVQESLLVAYSRLAGEYAVSYLTGLISRWGIARNKTQEFYQEIAFKALGNNKSEKAGKVLLDYTFSWSKKTRKMASEALSLRRQTIYGGK